MPRSAATCFFFAARTTRRTAVRFTARRPAAFRTPRRTAAFLTPRRTAALLTPRRATALRTTARRTLAPLRTRRRATLRTIRRSRRRATAFRTPRPATALLATRLALRTLRTALRTRLFATLFLIAIVSLLVRGQADELVPGAARSFARCLPSGGPRVGGRLRAGFSGRTAAASPKNSTIVGFSQIAHRSRPRSGLCDRRHRTWTPRRCQSTSEPSRATLISRRRACLRRGAKRQGADETRGAAGGVALRCADTYDH